MKSLILVSMFFGVLSAPAFAAPLALTEACKDHLITTAVAQENAWISARGDKVKSSLIGTAGLSYWPTEEFANVSVRVEDEADGRYVAYRAKVTKFDVEACRITLKRDESYSCRYSTGDGPEVLEDIEGFKFTPGRVIKPETPRTEIEDQQIRIFLGEGEHSTEPVAELIDNTDERKLSTALVTMPSGKKLDYLGAYAGDNPIGIFFDRATNKVAGVNSDDSVCLNYEK